MKRLRDLAPTAGMIILTALGATSARAHYDISPYLEDGALLTGGLDHAGVSYAPPISVYGYDFGEDEYDPFNPADPGVNQKAGQGNLPAGAPVRYNVKSSLLYWDGATLSVEGDPVFDVPPGQTYVSLLMGTTSRTLTGTSGPQTGSLVQSVASDGSLHKHFVTSLFDAPGTPNVPGEEGYVVPPEGIYAFSLELTLTTGGTTYTSDPLWIVFNHGMDEEVHDAAMEYFVPEPVTLLTLVAGVFGLRRRI